MTTAPSSSGQGLVRQPRQRREPGGRVLGHPFHGTGGYLAAMFPGTFAATAPDRPAVIMADDRRGGHLRRARCRGQPALARAPRGAGCSAGDHVALCLENHPRFLPVIWGAHYAGLYYTAMSSRLTTEEMAYIVDDCGAQAFVTSIVQGRPGRRARRPDARA